MRVRAATRRDVDFFYPDISSSFRAWVVEIEGKPQGIIGLALSRPYACLFSTVNEPLKPFLRSMKILKLIKKVETLFKARRLPVLAVAEHGMPTAPKILKRLGFEFLSEIDGDQIYVWWGE